MKYYVTDFVQASTRQTQKQVILEIVDAVIGGIVLLAFTVLVIGALYLIS